VPLSTSLCAPLVRIVEEAAALAVSPFTVYQMIRRAELHTYRVAKPRIRIDELALRDYHADREVAPLGPPRCPATTSRPGTRRSTGYDRVRDRSPSTQPVRARVVSPSSAGRPA
jgi:hypothetical protein